MCSLSHSKHQKHDEGFLYLYGALKMLSLQLQFIIFYNSLRTFVNFLITTSTSWFVLIEFVITEDANQKITRCPQALKVT